LKRGYNILICPLEWGLGHATRMIPLARKLRDMNNNVFIGSGEEHLSLFRKEVPGVSYINFSGFKPEYSRYLPQYLALLFRTPQLIFHSVREHFVLKKIISENDIDIVISDNRFGLWNRNITTVYITHMPLIPFPKPAGFLEFTGVLLHRSIIKKYSFCYIPDLPGELNFTGRLSHGVKLPDNIRFIGILSRFTPVISYQNNQPAKFEHNTVILSGPEPQRGMLKQKLVALLREEEPVTVMFVGNPGKSDEILRDGNIAFYNHLPESEMMEMIKTGKSIITRSGYTTIMELISLNCSALLIPTPGQTEQEYLAEYLSGKGWFSTVAQGKLKGGISLTKRKGILAAEIVKQSEILLSEALNDLFKEHHKKR
jgi:spore coat polysaccharide biosynthesis predicted glycosyltransferase SpsG